MNLRKAVLIISSLLIMLFGFQTVFAQESKVGMFFSGDVNMSKMDDINNIYIKGQELEGYKEVQFTYGVSGGFVYRFLHNFSGRLGFEFLFHWQNPSVELVWDENEFIQGEIRYRIRGYCPFLGIVYNSSIGSRYSFDIGLDVLYCMAIYRDELPDASELFAMLYGNSFGFVIRSNIRRKINNSFDLGLGFGYRFLNIEKLKIDTDYYTDYPGDVEFAIEGETLDLDFSGPFIGLLLYFKL